MDYQSQHQLRLAYMPWLYFRLKAKHLRWAEPWQEQLQTQLMALEDVKIEGRCFIAPNARLFAEPGRTIVLGDGSFIGSDAVLHGPIRIGEQVGINHHVSMDGGRLGIDIGHHCRIAAYSHFYAFNHGMAPNLRIDEQATSSQGIRLGEDVWVGAHAGLCDGSRMGDHSVLGMNALLTDQVAAWQIAAGNPARVIGDRRHKPHSGHAAFTGDSSAI